MINFRVVLGIAHFYSIEINFFWKLVNYVIVPKAVNFVKLK